MLRRATIAPAKIAREQSCWKQLTTHSTMRSATGPKETTLRRVQTFSSAGSSTFYSEPSQRICIIPDVEGSVMRGAESVTSATSDLMFVASAGSGTPARPSVSLRRRPTSATRSLDYSSDDPYRDDYSNSILAESSVWRSEVSSRADRSRSDTTATSRNDQSRSIPFDEEEQQSSEPESMGQPAVVSPPAPLSPVSFDTPSFPQFPPSPPPSYLQQPAIDSPATPTTKTWNRSDEFDLSSTIPRDASVIPAMIQPPVLHPTLIVYAGVEVVGTHSYALVNYVSPRLADFCQKQTDDLYHLKLPLEASEEWPLVQAFLEPHALSSSHVTPLTLPLLLPWFVDLEWKNLLGDCDVLLRPLVGNRSVRDLVHLTHIAATCSLSTTLEACLAVWRRGLNEGTLWDELLDGTWSELMKLVRQYSSVLEGLWDGVELFWPKDLSMERETLLANPLAGYLWREGLRSAVLKRGTARTLAVRGDADTSEEEAKVDPVNQSSLDYSMNTSMLSDLPALADATISSETNQSTTTGPVDNTTSSNKPSLSRLEAKLAKHGKVFRKAASDISTIRVEQKLGDQGILQSAPTLDELQASWEAWWAAWDNETVGEEEKSDSSSAPSLPDLPMPQSAWIESIWNRLQEPSRLPSDPKDESDEMSQSVYVSSSASTTPTRPGPTRRTFAC